MWRGSSSILASSVVVFSLVTAGMATPVAANKAARGAGDLARGTFVDGPRHTWREIRARPKRYAAMLTGLGAAGALAKVKGIDPEPFALALSGSVWVWQVKQAWPMIKNTRGRARLRAIGANIVWPFALVLGTGTLGHQVVHGHEGHGAAAAGLQTTVITSDIPTIVQHGMGHGREGE
jgi:hypothetical protein